MRTILAGIISIFVYVIISMAFFYIPGIVLAIYTPLECPTGGFTCLGEGMLMVVTHVTIGLVVAIFPARLIYKQLAQVLRTDQILILDQSKKSTGAILTLTALLIFYMMSTLSLTILSTLIIGALLACRLGMPCLGERFLPLALSLGFGFIVTILPTWFLYRRYRKLSILVLLAHPQN